MKKFFVLLLLSINSTFTHAMEENSGGAIWEKGIGWNVPLNTVQQLTGNDAHQIPLIHGQQQLQLPHHDVPQKHIELIDLDDDEEEPMRTGENPLQIWPHQNMPSDHQTQSGQTSQEPRALKSGDNRKRKGDEIDEAPSTPQIWPPNGPKVHKTHFADTLQHVPGRGSPHQNMVKEPYGKRQQLHRPYNHHGPQGGNSVQFVDGQQKDGGGHRQPAESVMMPMGGGDRHHHHHFSLQMGDTNQQRDSANNDGANLMDDVRYYMALNEKSRLESENLLLNALKHTDPEKSQKGLAENAEKIAELNEKIDAMRQKAGIVLEGKKKTERAEMEEQQKQPNIAHFAEGKQQQLGVDVVGSENQSENMPLASTGKDHIVGEATNVIAEEAITRDMDNNIAALMASMASIQNERAKKITLLAKIELQRKRSKNAAKIGKLAKEIAKLGHSVKSIWRQIFLNKMEPKFEKQYEMVQNKLEEKRESQGKLPLDNTLVGILDGKMAGQNDLAKNVAEFVKVARQIERLEQQEEAVHERRVYEAKLHDEPDLEEPQTERLEDCGPNPLQCNYCDAILCGIYEDFTCSWNANTKRCASFGF